ncbi:NUDIX domain-containing protein [Bradyrhizobium septentrionale]|uniref:NUDIX domain-containing protein n=1 Tax=Bradyrhizobium septentrionale TaxID=1404411 RepID=UPI001CCE4F3E|nr:NUDIX domain-containing protein [Bradyrhizobium septentrionale]UGY15127.1 NUDIX domain-containing protein [Bradyrhizobium septentrionale]
MTAAEKSTFAAPASATSGLQGYDLEGQKKKKKKDATKAAVDPDAGRHQAAGIAIVTPDGRALFMKRAPGGDHGGEWNFPGGGIDAGETAEEAAIRETLEEAGITLDPAGIRGQVCQIATGRVDFTTFVQRVEEKLAVKLNDEHTEARWEYLRAPPEPLHPGVRASLPLVISVVEGGPMRFAKGDKRTLYIKRSLRNGEALKSWAAANGFPVTLPIDDFHVTIAYSKEPVEWSGVPRSTVPIFRVEGGERHLERLGKEGEALVLRFHSDELASRHREIHDAGAVWRWPDFKSHVTLTYQGADIVIDEMAPFDGVLEFGPEQWAEIKENWMSTVVEKRDAGELDMDNLSLFVQIAKVDAAKRIVYGTAVVEEVDRANEIFDYATSKPHFEKWSGDIAKVTDGKSLGNVRSMHSAIAAGKLTDIGFDDARKAIDIAAKVVDDNEWKKVEEGVYTGFSIGGRYLKRWQDGDAKRYTAAPSEISLVDLPCGPSATFSMIKADGTEEMRKFAGGEASKPETTEEIVITNDMVAKRATEIATEKGGDWLVHIADARKALEDEAAAKKAAPVEQAAAEPVAAEAAAAEVAKGATATVEAGGTIENTATEGVDLTKTTPDDVAQVWASPRLPNQTFAKKGDLLKALAELEAKDAVAKAAAPVLDALKTGEKPAEVAKGADGDAKPEGETATVEKADLTTAEGVEKAITLFDALNASHVETRELVKAARALSLVDKLPEGLVFKGEAIEGDELAKGAGLYMMGDLTNMLACVQACENMTEGEWGIEVPKELRDRFGAALVDLGDIVAAVLDTVLTHIKAEEQSEALTRAAPLADLLKRGARHSAKDRAAIKEIHDTMVKLDKGCCGAAEKAAGDDLGKAIEANDLLKAQVAAASAAQAQLFKDIEAGIALKISDEVAKATGPLREEIATLTTQNGDLTKRVAEVSLYPAAVPNGPYRVAEKAIDMVTSDLAKITSEELNTRATEASMRRQMPTRGQV